MGFRVKGEGRYFRWAGEIGKLETYGGGRKTEEARTGASIRENMLRSNNNTKGGGGKDIKKWTEMGLRSR